MFDRMAKQLDLQTLGDAFCKKYDEPNYVLSILPDQSAVAHIKKFYVQ
jgi:hypothetical protein